MKPLFNKTKKGQMGLNILLSVVVSIFLIGLIIFIFSYMGGEIITEVDEATSEYVNATASTATLSKVYSGGDFTLYNTSNNTRATPTLINPLEYNVSGTTITLNANYSSAEVLAEYDAMGTSAIVANESRVAINNTVDWFGIIIVISAMVVLILLTTLIIRAIRGSGLQGGGREGGSRGSA